MINIKILLEGKATEKQYESIIQSLQKTMDDLELPVNITTSCNIKIKTDVFSEADEILNNNYKLPEDLK